VCTELLAWTSMRVLVINFRTGRAGADISKFSTLCCSSLPVLTHGIKGTKVSSPPVLNIQRLTDMIPNNFRKLTPPPIVRYATPASHPAPFGVDPVFSWTTTRSWYSTILHRLPSLLLIQLTLPAALVLLHRPPAVRQRRLIISTLPNPI
jgi:hypothetical protein